MFVSSTALKLGAAPGNGNAAAVDSCHRLQLVASVQNFRPNGIDLHPRLRAREGPPCVIILAVLSGIGQLRGWRASSSDWQASRVPSRREPRLQKCLHTSYDG